MATGIRLGREIRPPGGGEVVRLAHTRTRFVQSWTQPRDPDFSAENFFRVEHWELRWWWRGARRGQYFAPNGLDGFRAVPFELLSQLARDLKPDVLTDADEQT